MSEKSSRSNSEFEFIGSPELEPVRSPFSDDDITEYLENLDISNSEESTNIRELENALNLARKDAAELRAKKFSNSELRKQNSQLQERVDELLAEVNRRIVGEECLKYQLGDYRLELQKANQLLQDEKSKSFPKTIIKTDRSKEELNKSESGTYVPYVSILECRSATDAYFVEDWKTKDGKSILENTSLNQVDANYESDSAQLMPNFEFEHQQIDIDIQSQNVIPCVNNRNARLIDLSDDESDSELQHSDRQCQKVTPCAISKQKAIDSEAGIMKEIKLLGELPHGDVVCTAVISSDNRRVCSGGRGNVKLWNVHSFTGQSNENEEVKAQKCEPICNFNCFDSCYVRCCKLFRDDSKMIVCGECPKICIWDLNAKKLTTKLSFDSQACYSHVNSADDRIGFSACSEGNIVVWDFLSQTKVAEIMGHSVAGVASIDLDMRNSLIWTGGLDSIVKCWDFRKMAELTFVRKYEFDSPVFSVSCSPRDDWLVVGKENGEINLQNYKTNDCHRTILDHENALLSVKFAHSGKWFAAGGKDNVLSTWPCPDGQRLAEQNEDSTILCCDISADDKFIITGSGARKASIYQLL